MFLSFLNKLPQNQECPKLLIAHSDFTLVSCIFQDFPKDTPKELIDAMIGLRKPLVKDFHSTLKGKISIKDFSAKWLTDDAELEDPFTKYVMANFPFKCLSTYCANKGKGPIDLGR